MVHSAVMDCLDWAFLFLFSSGNNRLTSTQVLVKHVKIIRIGSTNIVGDAFITNTTS